MNSIPDIHSAPRTDVAVLVPCYNVGGLCGPVVEQVQRYSTTVLAVDDGSTDQTATALARTGVELLRHHKNKGKGSALLTGFRALLERHGIAAVVTIDGDGQHDPAAMPDFVRCWRETGAAIVVGNRMANVAAMPWVRRHANVYSTRLIQWLAGVPLADAQCGYRLYDLETLRRLLPDLREGRYELETEVLLLAVRTHLPIAFVPIETIYNDAAHASSNWRALRDSYHIARVLLRHVARRRI